MDDTQASIKTTEAAAATRKRRSSILKNQRPPRTPFSELEFNVATPTDTAKSRRVSFSRRTGVAEFVTNEATTTWKNFYEEHNKSLESSGNETAANARRPVVGHIGKRIFDQQFEEVEVVDIGGTLQTNTAVQQFQCSFNNVNLTQQLMAFELDCIEDDKALSAPAQHFELNNLTDHNSKVFGNDFSVPIISEISNPISMNFSNVQPIGKCDDLEEIARDLGRPHQHVICPGPFSAKDVSEYIEVDLNMTNVVIRNKDCDMSITDTIHSPEVQALAKQTSIRETKVNEVVDKENIIINPYITPKESANFAINEEFDKVLVFDGKKLTVQSERQSIVEPKQQEIQNTRSSPGAVPKRKRIVLNINDDLPNFIPDSSSLTGKQITGEEKKMVLYNDCDLSITQAVGAKIEVPKRKTIVFDDDMGNLSITQALPAEVITNKEEKRKTIIYDNNEADISITQAVPTNKIVEKKTFVFEDELSFTQDLPANVVLNKTSENKTIYYPDGLDISVTKAMTDNIISLTENKDAKNDMSKISITQAIPTNIIINEVNDNTKKSMAYSFTDNIDITQVLQNNIICNNEKRKTIVYDSDTGDISLTKAIPTNILLESDVKLDKNNLSILNKSENIDFKSINSKRKTIIYNNEQADISMTQVIPSNIIATKSENNEILLNNIELENCEKMADKRKTIIYDNEEGNVSTTQVIPAYVLQTTEVDANKVMEDTDLMCNNEKMTQAIPINIIQAQIKNIEEIEKQTDVGGSSTTKRQNFIYNKEEGEVTMDQIIPTNIIKSKSIIQDNEETKNRRKTVIYDSEEADLSITEAMPPNIVLTKLADNKIPNFNESLKIISNKRETITYDNNVCDVSMTQVIPTNIIQTKINVNKTEVTLDDINMDISISHNLSTRIMLNEERVQNESRNNSNIDNQNKTLSNHPTEKLNHLEESKYNVNNMSMTNPIPAEIMSFQNDILKKNEIDADKSIYAAELQIAVHQNILVYQTTENTTIEPEIKFDYEKNDVEKHINTSDTSKTTLNSNGTNYINCEYEENDAKDTIITEQTSETCSKYDANVKQNKKSILSELLDMSNASLVDVDKSENEIKYSPIKMMTNDVNAKDYVNSKTTSNNDLSIRDSHSEIKNGDNNFENIGNNIENIDINIENEIIQNSEIIQKSLDKDEENESKNDKAKPDIDECHQKSNRYFEKILSSDLQKSNFLDQSNFNSNKSVIRDFKSIRDADNTKDLLDMLSDLTDGQTKKYEKSIVANVKDVVPSNEPIRLSFMPKTQSIVLSREELLNNISMAQAALRLSRSYNDSDNIEDAEDSSEEMVPSPEESCVKSLNKSVRMSTEVVKTLHFDESVSETSITADMNKTPLKKTTFGETTFIGENKAKVIPTYLKDVSDGIKYLMIDLVKPTADIPLTDKPIKKPPSTCSTQIQANLVTSSQIEIDTELGSNSESAECMRPTESLIGEVAAVGQRAVTQALRQSFKPVMPMDVEQESKLILQPEIQSPPRNITKKSAPSPVIVFDHLNPLNNILLAQMDCSKVHAYNPLKENAEEVNKSYEKKENQIKVERISTHYLMDERSHQQTEIRAGYGMEKISELNTVLSNISKPLSIDRSTEGIATELKHTEINTVIAMKNNNDLLENNSSLTLVDDALDQPLDIDMEDLHNIKKSPVKIIYKVEEDLLKDSDLTSNDEYEPTKPKKRSYSPTRQDKKLAQPVDITPKPVSKMQKISFSPKTLKLAPKSPESPKIVQKSSQDKKMSSKKRNSLKHDVTVQQLITDCYKDAGADRKVCQNLRKSESSSTETLEVETMSKTFQSIKSSTTFTSSKNILPNNLLENRCSDQKTVLNLNPSSLSEFSSYTNIMSKIQMLPFMRTRDCEWETCKKDMWSFLLLRSRVRLVVRFTRNHDKPITCLTVDPVYEKEKEPSSTLCVRLAAEAMRYECTQCGDMGTGMGTDVNMEMGAGMKADAIPGLLRRCVEVSRLAILWARVMRDARLRLAYIVNKHGDLTFKVVNFQLRAVWEVHLRIELVVDDDQHLACPRAGLIRVVPVLGGGGCSGSVGSVGGSGGVEGPLGALLDSVRKDWGHAPVALWKIFHYLKNKTKDEDLGL